MGMSLVNLGPGVWSSAQILRLPGIRFPVRVGVFQLADRSLMLVSPTPRIGELAAEISALGPVSAIVEPNALHHLGLAAARAAFPGARSFGPPGLARKISGQPLPERLVDGPGMPWEGAVDLVAVEGMPRAEETALFHRSSGTLWVTDLAFNVRTSDHLPTRLFMRLNGAYGRFAHSRIARTMVRDPGALRRTVDRLLALAPERLLPAHGDPVEADATRVLAEAFAHLPAC
jgi:Domain of unknown function (DUF4336)